MVDSHIVPTSMHHLSQAAINMEATPTTLIKGGSAWRTAPPTPSPLLVMEDSPEERSDRSDRSEACRAGAPRSAPVGPTRRWSSQWWRMSRKERGFLRKVEPPKWSYTAFDSQVRE